MPGSDFQFSICHTAGSSENADAGRHSRLKIESLTLHPGLKIESLTLHPDPAPMTLHPRGAVEDVGRKNSALSSFLKNRFMPSPNRLMILLGGG
jgi:hypothetical protein